MADVASNLAAWSATTNSNSPAGTATVGTGVDDNFREVQGVIVRGLSNKGSDIASATTTDLGAVEGLMHDITGTTTITGFGTVRAGIWKVIKFEGALTLTHNSTSLILPGGANITTAIGDVAIVGSEGSGNWRCWAYMKADGGAVLLTGANISALTADATPDKSADYVATYDASATAAKKVLLSKLAPSVAILSLDQTSGTAGGGTTATTWTKYPLNTEVVDADGLTALSSNTFDLTAGTYEIEAFAYFYSADANANAGKLRLRNTTDGATSIVGGNHNTPALSGSNVPNICWLQGVVTISGTKTFELQYYVTTAKATSGLGVAITSGEVERYGQITIRKLY